MIIHDASAVVLTPELLQEFIDRTAKQGIYIYPQVTTWREYLRIKEEESETHEN